LPHNLYYELMRGSFSPSLFQLFAFSRISGYRLSGWLRVFGFDLEAIPRLQVQLPTQRTMILDSSVADPSAPVAWFRSLRSPHPIGSVAPLSQVLGWAKPRPLGSLTKPTDNRFSYLKIGELDAIAFPDLLAGSVVRVNLAVTEDDLREGNNEITRRLFLIGLG
jgi:hypothetical protein